MSIASEACRPVAAPFKIVADGIRVRIKVTPRAAADRIEGLAPEADGSVALKVAVTAPPEDGKANAAVIKLLAREWGLAKSAVTVAAGAADRRKTLHLVGDPHELGERVGRWFAERTPGGTSRDTGP